MPDFKKNYGAKKPFNSRGPSRFSDNDGPKQMYSSECSSCHKPCEVPFRPNGKKPIFCSNCFKRDNDHGGNGFSRDSRDSRSVYQKPDYSASRSFDRAAPVQEDRRIDDLKRQVAALDAKVDTLIQLLGSSRIKESANAREEVTAASAAPTTEPVSRPAKKAAAPVKKAAKAAKKVAKKK